MTSRWSRDHPRSRGVYWGLTGSACARAGSSPLARGLRITVVALLARMRIIPARAGFTAKPEYASAPPTDHPRSRGVYSREKTLPALRSGSSPLARGLLKAVNAPSRPFRIIPARAGFTSNTCAGRTRAWDHPRSRGVYLFECGPRRVDVGSSPLARGLQVAQYSIWAAAGIIPARAGFTAKPEYASAPPTDHPRSRGVYPCRGRSRSQVRGSSPLARGLPVRHVSGSPRVRIIPARAGFTGGHPGRR